MTMTTAVMTATAAAASSRSESSKYALKPALLTNGACFPTRDPLDRIYPSALGVAASVRNDTLLAVGKFVPPPSLSESDPPSVRVHPFHHSYAVITPISNPSTSTYSLTDVLEPKSHKPMKTVQK